MPMALSPQMEASKPELDVGILSMPDSAIQEIKDLQAELRQALEAKAQADKMTKAAQDEVKMAEEWAEDMEKEWEDKFAEQEKEIKQLKSKIGDQQKELKDVESGGPSTAELEIVLRDERQKHRKAQEDAEKRIAQATKAQQEAVVKAEDLSAKLDAAEKKALAMEEERDTARTAEEAAVEELNLAEKWADEMTRKWKMDLASKQEEIDEFKKLCAASSKHHDSADVRELQAQIAEQQKQNKELQAQLQANAPNETSFESQKVQDTMTANEALSNENTSLQKELSEAQALLRTALKSASESEKNNHAKEAAEQRAKQKDEKCAQLQKEIESFHKEMKSLKGASSAVAKETKKEDEEKKRMEIRLTQALEQTNEMKKQQKADMKKYAEENQKLEARLTQALASNNKLKNQLKNLKSMPKKAPGDDESNAAVCEAELDKCPKEAEAAGGSPNLSPKPCKAKKGNRSKSMLSKMPTFAWALLMMASIQAYLFASKLIWTGKGSSHREM